MKGDFDEPEMERPPSANSGRPIKDLTLPELFAEREYWRQKVNDAPGVASASAAQEFWRECDREIASRERQDKLASPSITARVDHYINCIARSLSRGGVPFTNQELLALRSDLVSLHQELIKQTKVIAVGDRVEKFTDDYVYYGTVRSIFTNLKGATRYVVEHDHGFLHICRPTDVRAVADDNGS